MRSGAWQWFYPCFYCTECYKLITLRLENFEGSVACFWWRIMRMNSVQSIFLWCWLLLHARSITLEGVVLSLRVIVYFVKCSSTNQCQLIYMKVQYNTKTIRLPLMMHRDTQKLRNCNSEEKFRMGQRATDLPDIKTFDLQRNLFCARFSCNTPENLHSRLNFQRNPNTPLRCL